MPAPDAELVTWKGDHVKLASLRGQVVVINFWATWCGPCKVELPLLDSYYRSMHDKGLVVVAATTEDSVPASALSRVFRAMAITPLVRIKGPYAPIRAVPTNFVIDRAGVVRYAAAGALDQASLDTIVGPLLREHPGVQGSEVASLP